MALIAYLLGFLTAGSFLYIDLPAAYTNALKGTLLAQRPDHYKDRYIREDAAWLGAILGNGSGGRRLRVNEYYG